LGILERPAMNVFKQIMLGMEKVLIETVGS